MKKQLLVEGTHCKSCKLLIEDICSEIPGVKKCSVNFQTGKMTVEYEDEVDWSLLKKEIEKAGKYKVKLS